MTGRLVRLGVMSTHDRPILISRAARLLGLVLLLCCATAWGATGVVTAQPRTVTAQLTAYARVVPIAIATLLTAQAGVVQALNAEPGQHVATGTALGKLGGPEIQALLAQRRGAVAAAQAAVKASRELLRIARQQRVTHLSTRQAVYKAQSAQTQAKARLSAAQTALQAAKHNTRLRAPDSGTIISLAAASGERVGQGQTILTLQPDHRLWVKAIYYGSDTRRLHVGMAGRFIPADGSTPIAVQIARVMPSIQTGGGLPVGLRAQNKSESWRSGEAGTVVLQGTRQTGVTIPTRALILYHSQWWVLIKAPNGDRRQRVTPGSSRGSDTLITRGLSAGTQVVVDNAYLRFHRDFSQHYQPPD